jgi:transglutaminase-like putative cysteine protease
MTALRHLRLGCEFVHEAEIDTATVLQVEPDRGGPATVGSQEWHCEPVLDRHSYVDSYGNVCQRLTLPQGRSTLHYDARVTVPDATEEIDLDAGEVPVAALPDGVLLYTVPSRYVVPDLLADEAWELFGALKPGYRRVQAICEHVHGSLRFAYGSTTSTWTAADVRASGIGVCRDFTHLALSYCRALNIPARYVFGYLPDLDVEPLPEPMDFAAWMEVFLEGRWWTFDPRNNTARKGRVVVGRGRDAVDVAMVTTFGGPVLVSMTVWAEEAGS